MELDGTSQHVGQATWFVSHTWNNSFLDTLDAILLFFQGRDDAATAKLWIDVLVTPQITTASIVSSQSFSFSAAQHHTLGRVMHQLQ